MDGPGTVSPLPVEYRQGAMSLLTIGAISLVSASLLFLHITYKLILLWLRRNKDDTPRTEVDLSLGLSEEHYKQAKTGTVFNHEQQNPQAAEASQVTHDAEQRKRRRKQKRAPNPLLILIYNLILSDISMSATYVGNIYWLMEDAINIDAPNCRAQGWLVSFGCVVTSAFLLTLATYTYAIVIKGWRPSHKSTVLVSLGIWVASIVVTCLGPMFSGKEHYYARQQFWCWIEGSNAGWRLTVYIPGFFCLCSAFTVYTWTFWCLHQRRQSARMMPRSSNSSTVSDASRGIITNSGRKSSVGTTQLSQATSSRNADATNDDKKNHKLRPSGHHPAFLIYPVIYTLLASPLTLGSITPLEHNFLFMTVSAAMLSSLGFFNAILWACTILFSRREDLVDTGLEYFTFMRTPSDREYGNMIWVQGGAARPPYAGEGNAEDEEQGGPGGSGVKKRWYTFGRERRSSDSEIPLRDQLPASGKIGGGGARGTRADSGAESGMGTDREGITGGGGGGIRMDVSTTIVVEDSRTPTGFGVGGS